MERDYKRLEHNGAEVGAWERSQSSRAGHIALTHQILYEYATFT